MLIHHIGYAVRNIEKAITKFKYLGYGLKGAQQNDENRKVKIQFLEKDGVLIELVESSDTSSPVQNFIKKNGNSP